MYLKNSSRFFAISESFNNKIFTTSEVSVKKRKKIVGKCLGVEMFGEINFV